MRSSSLPTQTSPHPHGTWAKTPTPQSPLSLSGSPPARYGQPCHPIGPSTCQDSAWPSSPLPLTQVHEDYSCTLNQTNIVNNNNKFYIIQLLETPGGFACWNRWGRVVRTTPFPASSCPGP